ncbi:hypothetical protein ANCCAN_15077 [Ancylostoma caninum]|uniref:Uncharacterized protein n=1 Tax=Ancylostoma caninum TaxID=29170 RepID=A0A368G3H8_ANCCA|nr:hypothetical protein ANCCAN_15077 [Ancylostoma caninum]
MVHPDRTIMERTLAKSRHLVKLRGVLYEPKCGEPTCFHEWFRNCDHGSNPVREHIQMFDDVYPTVRETIAVNLAGAADRRKLHRAYRVYCHQVFAKVTTGDQETGICIFYLFENVFVTHCSMRYDHNGFFFITRHRGASIIVRFLFYIDLQNVEQWHVSITTTSVIIGEENVRTLVREALARKMSLCEFIEVVLWPFIDFVNDKM